MSKTSQLSVLRKVDAISKREEAKSTLLKYLTPGQTVYCILRHVSRSGMMRRISFHVVDSDNSILSLDYYMARAMNYRNHKDGGLIVTGCGMDMGFSVVYNLGATLWPHGTPAPHGIRNGESDSDGGYALKSRWL